MMFSIRNNHGVLKGLQSSSFRFLPRKAPSSNYLFPQQTTKRFIEYYVNAAASLESLNNNDNNNNNNKRRKKNERHKQKKKNKSQSSYQFIDRCRIRVKGGDGGKGSLSTQIQPRKRHIRPDGGHGGYGGSVIIVADPNEQSLHRWNPHIAADNGTNGTSQDCHGAKGKNRILRVPPGVVIKRILDYNEQWDEVNKRVIKLGEEEISNDNHEMEEMNEDYGESYNNHINYDDFSDDDDENLNNKEDREVVTIADLDEPGSFVVVANGGKGGIGTSIYASRSGAMPNAWELKRRAQPEIGEIAHLELELKLIADIGLVGFPNAGKSSLLHAVSAASPKIAPYPFTTLHPLIGIIEYQDGYRVRVADIPGLIHGASIGKGKGHDFLRHIERTKALIYMVDIAGVDKRDPIEDLKILANELASYGDGSLLMDRRALIVANKVDLLNDDRTNGILFDIQNAAIEVGIQFEDDVIGISAGVTGQGLNVLSKAIRNIILKSEADKKVWFESA